MPYKVYQIWCGLDHWNFNPINENDIEISIFSLTGLELYDSNDESRMYKSKNKYDIEISFSFSLARSGSNDSLTGNSQLYSLYTLYNGISG